MVGLVESGLGLFQFLLLLSSPFSPSCGKVYGVLSFFNKTRKRWPVHSLTRTHIYIYGWQLFCLLDHSRAKLTD